MEFYRSFKEKKINVCDAVNYVIATRDEVNQVIDF